VRSVIVVADVLIALPVAAFGVWRIMCGLSRLEMIDRRVPGSDLFVRHLPKVMRASEGVGGAVDLFNGALLVFAALALAINHPSS
jgi:hypothetical protein